MDENGEPEFPQCLQTTHLQHGFLWDTVGGFQQEANALVGFQCFDREGWSQQFPRAGQEVFSYTSCIATPHSPMHQSFWFYADLLEVSSSVSTCCAGLDELSSNISSTVFFVFNYLTFPLISSLVFFPVREISVWNKSWCQPERREAKWIHKIPGILLNRFQCYSAPATWITTSTL